MNLRTKRILIGAAVALAAGALLFFFGWLRGTQVEGARADEIEAARAEVEGELEQARGELGRLGARVALLESRAACARALEALDDRNFGIAEDQLTQVAQRAADVPAAAEARRLAEALELTIAEDLSDQRARLRQVCAALDAALSPSSTGR